MKSRLCGQSLKIAAYAMTSALAVASLAGCGASGNFVQSSVDPDTTISALSGNVHGGPNPVIGATVTLYATKTIASPAAGNAYGYGQAGTVLGSTTTNSSGNFQLTGDASSCPSGQQAYIVAAGGHTGSNTTNSAAVLMAALGPCSGVSNTTAVVIDEPTTIAAAYALSGFMTVTGTGSSTVVNISAPANNNAATAACTTSGSSPNVVTTGCAASGLAHAFLNAASLVNANAGTPNAAPPSNSAAVVPSWLINTLANSVQACVNSTGTITGTTAPCAILMTNTGNPAIALNPNLSAPTNTLQALLDLAQYPSAANGCPTAPCAAGTGTGAPVGSAVPSAATTALYNLAASNAFYYPAVTATPLDFTIAIAYPEAGALWGSAADISDHIYVYDNETPVTVFSLASNGATRWSTPNGHDSRLRQL